MSERQNKNLDKADEVMEWEEITDTELDIILKRSRKYGRCLFRITGSDEQHCFIEGEVEERTNG